MNPSSFVFMSAWTCFLFYIDAKRILQAGTGIKVPALIFYSAGVKISRFLCTFAPQPKKALRQMPSYWSSSSKISITLESSNNYKVAEINELYRNIPSVSEKVLSQVLRQLTADGIIRRELFPDVPPRTEYSVSDFGKTLLPHVEDLLNWGRDNFDTIMSNRQKRQS